MNGSQLNRGEVFVKVMILILVVVGEASERGEGNEDQQARDTFYGEPGMMCSGF